jgi:cytochrome c biogenesis protein CcmG/thiol:disulfide interchange protein DsbE
MKRALFLVPLALFLGLAVYFAVGLTKDPRILPSALIDKPAPEFALDPLKDGEQGLAKGDLGGEVVLVNVFASWCVPCRAEHPVLMRLAEEKTIPIYGINYKDRKKEALAWLDELGDPYQRIGHDLSGRAGINWGVYGVPETYVIGRDGRIRYRHVGPLFPEILEKTILPLIEELRQ